jgi:hypothetical protein
VRAAGDSKARTQTAQPLGIRELGDPRCLGFCGPSGRNCLLPHTCLALYACGVRPQVIPAWRLRRRLALQRRGGFDRLARGSNRIRVETSEYRPLLRNDRFSVATSRTKELNNGAGFAGRSRGGLSKGSERPVGRHDRGEGGLSYPGSTGQHVNTREGVAKAHGGSRLSLSSVPTWRCAARTRRKAPRTPSCGSLAPRGGHPDGTSL